MPFPRSASAGSLAAPRRLSAPSSSHAAGRRSSSAAAPRARAAPANGVASNVVSVSPPLAAAATGAPAPQQRLFAQEVLAGPAPGRLANRATTFVEEHRVRGYECGPDRETTICTIANLLQEVASNHAVALWGRTEAGFATDPIMVEKGLIFAATRIQIQMDAYPTWGDMLAMETWFQEEGRVAACRNWTLSDALSGRPLGRATSTWVMVNVATRRLAKMPDEMRAKMPLLAPNPPRDSVAPAQARRKLPDLDDGPATASFDGAVFEGPVQTARRADMDMNGHINNVTYLAWVLETVPADVIAAMRLAEVEIDYKAECLAGQTVECVAARTLPPPEAAPGAVSYMHELRRCDGETCYELVRARTTWVPRK